MPDPVLQIQDLVKCYGNQRVVDRVSFNVAPGSCVALLGPNGAGKTTTISIIAGLITPNSGSVLIHGRTFSSDTDPLKQGIGLVPQDLALYDELSALENLRFFGSLYDIHGAPLREAIERSLTLVGLESRSHDRVGTFSGGMKRRLNLAASLLHNPSILLLDEPTVGVDPQSRNAIFDTIETLVRIGKTVLYTTHYMEEVERLCEQVVIMDHGRVVANDTLSQLKSRSQSSTRLRFDLDNAPSQALIQALSSIPNVSEVRVVQHQIQLTVPAIDQTTEIILATLRSHATACSHISSDRPNLEAVFLELTGRNLRDA